MYSTPISITADTVVEAYSQFGGKISPVVKEDCEHLSDIPIEYSNRTLGIWKRNGQNVELPYSINAIDGHSSSYAKGTFNFETSFNLRAAQPTYLWFQHADQSASVYIDNNRSTHFRPFKDSAIIYSQFFTNKLNKKKE